MLVHIVYSDLIMLSKIAGRIVTKLRKSSAQGYIAQWRLKGNGK